MRLITELDFNPKVHVSKHGLDGYGDPLEPPVGYRLLGSTEVIQIGDRHFDIYNGWRTGGEGYFAKLKSKARGKGRWTGWARKLTEVEVILRKNK